MLKQEVPHTLKVWDTWPSQKKVDNKIFWAFGRAFPCNLFVLKKEAQKGFPVQSLTQNLASLKNPSHLSITQF